MQTKIPTYLTNIFQNVMWKLCVELGHKIVFKFLAFINLFLGLEKLELGQKKNPQIWNLRETLDLENKI